MKDEQKTKKQLIAELTNLRRSVAKLEQTKTKSRQAEKALRQSEAKYRALVESATDFIHMIDKQNKVLSVNKAGAKLFGRKPKDLIGKSIMDLFPKEIAARFSKNLRKVFKTGKPSSHQSKMVVGQKESWISVKLSPVQDGTGKVAAVMGVTRDITVQRQVEERYHDLIEREKDIIYTLDNKGNITYANPAVKKILGYHPNELIGTNFILLVPKDLQEKTSSDFNHLLKAGETTAETALLDKKGRLHFVEYSSTVMREDNKVVGTRGIARDITERKRAEEELKRHREHLEELVEERTTELRKANKQLRREITERKRAEVLQKTSTKRFEDIIENAFEWIWEVDAEGRYTYTSPVVEKILGYKPEEVLGKHFYDLFHPEDLEALKKAASEAFSKKQSFREFANRNIHKNGKTIWLSTSGVPILDEKGDLIGYRGADTDITERKQVEEALREERNKAQRYLDVAGVMFLVIDANQKVNLVNKKGCEILGYREEEIVGKNWFANFVPKRIRNEVRATFEKLMTGKIEPVEYFENPVLTKGGEEKLIAWHNIVLRDEKGKINATLSSGEDVTDRRRAEAIQRIQHRIANAIHTTEDLNELFRAIQQDLSTFLDTKNFFIALYDKESDTLSLPYFKDEKDHFETFPAGKTLTAYVIRNDKPLLATNEEFERLAQTGEVETVGTDSKIWLGVPLKAKDEIVGALVVQSYTDENAYDEKDLELLKFVSNQIGLSIERKKAQEALRGSEERYRIITDQTGQLIYDYDVEAGTIDWSGAIEAVTGYSSKEFQRVDNNAWKEMIHPEDRNRTLEFFAQTERNSPKYCVEYRFRTKGGEYKNIQEEGLFLRSKNGKIYRLLGIMKDITEHKQAEKALRESEEQLRQSQKMEAVGRLAGGIAHDLNNLLTGVTGYSDLLSAHIEDGHPLHKFILEIQKAAQRATTLIRQLLAFSRKQMLQPRMLNLNDTVKDIEKMLQRIIGEDVELVTNLDIGLGHVKADPGQIEQVIMNLAVNARDAMPQGGKLIIETSNVDLDREYTRLHMDSQPGPYVMLAVSDTGDGMDEETRSHIFEPFFTTKEVGKGTGLGLPTVYGIVKQSGGNIWVYSEPGKGTTFKVYLPRIRKNGKISQPDLTISALEGGSETILVVEDEEIVRELLDEILEKCGYTVLVADQGQKALSICERHKGPIHLMITDMIMPKMNGRELAERLTQLRSETKVLYISGYSDDLVVQREQLDSETAFLQKPFTSQALTRKVRQVLDKSQKKKRRCRQEKISKV